MKNKNIIKHYFRTLMRRLISVLGLSFRRCYNLTHTYCISKSSSASPVKKSICRATYAKFQRKSILLCFFAFIINASIPAFAAETVTINVYNWGGHIADGSNSEINANEEFTRCTGIKVNYTTYQDNESMFAKFCAGGTTYDVIIPSDYMTAKMISLGMLQKLDFKAMPNASLIDSNFLNPQYDPQNEYSVPYTWGSIGIYYNKVLVNEPEDEIDWDILWNPKYKSKILMMDNPRDAFAISAFRLGLDINSKKAEDWQAAAAGLKEQKPLVSCYIMDQIFDKIKSGEAALAPYYIDTLFLTQNPDIGYVIPKSVTNKFMDAMCVPAHSMHPNEAMKYINFMCDPKIAINNITSCGALTPQSVVKANLPAEITQNENFYPNSEQNMVSYNYLSGETDSLIRDLWIEIKTDSANNRILFYFIFAGLIVTYLAVTFFRNRHIKNI